MLAPHPDRQKGLYCKEVTDYQLLPLFFTIFHHLFFP